MNGAFSLPHGTDFTAAGNRLRKQHIKCYIQSHDQDAYRGRERILFLDFIIFLELHGSSHLYNRHKAAYILCLYTSEPLYQET